VGLVGAPLVFVGLLAFPLPGLEVPAQRLAAVWAATILLWITEAVPLPVTALAAPATAVLLGVASPEQVFAPFADPLIFLFLGGFLLAEGLSSQGFDRRAALWVMARRVVASSPRRAAIALALTSFGFSMWISNTATTAMMIPIALGLRRTMSRALPDDRATQARLDRFCGGMLLLIAYAASIGGISTPIGTGPNVIAMGILKRQLDVRIDFLAWMTFAFPAALAILAAMLWLFARGVPPPVARLEGLTAEVDRELRELGPAQAGELRAMGVFALAIVGWVAPSVARLVLDPGDPLVKVLASSAHEGVVAILCAALLFVLPAGARTGPGTPSPGPILRWERAQAIDWGTLLLLGGGVSLGKLAFDVGLARALGEAVLSLAGNLARAPLGMLVVATFLVLWLTEVTSNSATTSTMLPVLIALAQTADVDPVPTAVCATLAASMAFSLPVSTPPNAMAYGTGLVRLPDMVRFGVRLNLAAYAVLVLVGTCLAR
jgi:sodium-dependent dicarboxylate transporter 2/3/5